jgi:ribosomal protein S18 acetylase RimI-like enzyme
MLVRTAKEGDAEGVLELLLRLDEQTRLMMYEPGERSTSVGRQAETLRTLLASGNSTFLLAEEDGRPVGFLEATGGTFRRNRHVVHLVVGVLKEHAGRGIGSALMAEAERWARERGTRRLELTVQTHNRAARALYEKMGFAVEGTRKDAVHVEGSYVDEFYMAKLLG